MSTPSEDGSGSPPGPPRAAARRPYRAPALRSHGRLRDIVRQGNTLPAPDPLTGLTNQGT